MVDELKNKIYDWYENWLKKGNKSKDDLRKPGVDLLDKGLEGVIEKIDKRAEAHDDRTSQRLKTIAGPSAPDLTLFGGPNDEERIDNLSDGFKFDDADGKKAISLPSWISVDAFKKMTNAGKMRTREAELKRIDLTLKQLGAAKSLDEQKLLMKITLGACGHWWDNKGKFKGHNIRLRAPRIRRLAGWLAGQLGESDPTSAGEQGGAAVGTEGESSRAKKVEKRAESTASAGTKVKGAAVGTEGGSKVAEKMNLGNTATAGAVADGAGSAVGGIGAVVGVANLVKDVATIVDESGQGITRERGLDLGTDMARNAADIVSGVSSSVKHIAKLAGGTKELIASSAQAAAVAGIVSGSIDAASGMYKLGSTIRHQRKIDAADSQSKELLKQARKSQADEYQQVLVKIAWAEASLDGSQLDLELVALGACEKEKTRSKVEQNIKSWEQTLKDLKLRKIELESMRKEIESQKEENSALIKAATQVQDRRGTAGGLKIATGLMDVGAGVLMLSGIGAPVAIALSVISGLIKVGAGTMKWRRKKASNRLTEVATRLGSDGTVKGKPDAEQPSFRAMESRVTMAYYRNWEAVALSDTPGGMKSGEWGDIKNYVKMDKRSNVPKEKTVEREKGKTSDVALGERRASWLKLVNSSHAVIGEERGGKGAGMKLAFTADARKSEAGVDASNDDLAQGIVTAALGCFNPTTSAFHDAQIIPVGSAAPETPEALLTKARSQTTLGILQSVGLSESSFAGLYEKAGGTLGDGATDATHSAVDRATLKGGVKKYVSSQ